MWRAPPRLKQRTLWRKWTRPPLKQVSHHSGAVWANHKLLSFIHTFIQQISIKYLLYVALEVVKQQTRQTHSLKQLHLNSRITNSDSSLFLLSEQNCLYQTYKLITWGSQKTIETSMQILVILGAEGFSFTFQTLKGKYGIETSHTNHINSKFSSTCHWAHACTYSLEKTQLGTGVIVY